MQRRLAARTNKIAPQRFRRCTRSKMQKVYVQRWKACSRLSELECRQNIQTCLRDEYTERNSRGDGGLEDHMTSMNGLDPGVAERFRSMTQSDRLKAIRHDPAFSCFNDAPWGGLQWRVLGCPTDVASERTQIIRARRKNAHPIIFDPIGLHGHICGVANAIVERLESRECDLTPSTSDRGLIATLLALSLYGLGSARFCDQSGC